MNYLLLYISQGIFWAAIPCQPVEDQEMFDIHQYSSKIDPEGLDSDPLQDQEMFDIHQYSSKIDPEGLDSDPLQLESC
ncbi:hypothetical protein QE152_g6204 [Popillia japonica]|uniref:Uncharacterized protein n=1 Tax=Popillia japonica TaxID=7064 RepID=A0AAW1MJC6_POPJA